MFIHSVEADLNRVLEERITNRLTGPLGDDLVCFENFFGFPDISNVVKYDSEERKRSFVIGNIIGHDTKSLTQTESDVLEELGLTLESFKVKGLEELNSKGTYRVLFAPFKEMSHSYDEQQQTLELRFSLPAGSYATVLIDEFVTDKKSSIVIT